MTGDTHLVNNESRPELRADQIVRLAELTHRFRGILASFETMTGQVDWPGRRGVHSVEPPQPEPENTVLARIAPILKETVAEIKAIEAEIPAEEQATPAFKALLEQSIKVHAIIDRGHLMPGNRVAQRALDAYFTMHRIKAERLFVEMYGPEESMPPLPQENPDPENGFARVLIAIDYEGIRQGARRRFAGPAATPEAGHVNPFTLARLIIERRAEPSVVEQVLRKFGATGEISVAVTYLSGSPVGRIPAKLVTSHAARPPHHAWPGSGRAPIPQIAQPYRTPPPTSAEPRSPVPVHQTPIQVVGSGSGRR